MIEEQEIRAYRRTLMKLSILLIALLIPIGGLPGTVWALEPEDLSDYKDCGARSVMIALHSFGIECSLDEAIKGCNSQDGISSLADLENFAREKGLSEYSVEASHVDDLFEIDGPLIIAAFNENYTGVILDYLHFVIVFEEEDKESVSILDPNKSPEFVTFSKDLLEQFFSGYALVLSKEELAVEAPAKAPLTAYVLISFATLLVLGLLVRKLYKPPIASILL